MKFQANPTFVQELAKSDEIHDVVHDAAMQIHDVFRAIAPQDTGRMVRSTHVQTTRNARGWFAEVLVPVITLDGRKTQYAKFVEFGTRYMDAQHNLRHSLEIVEQDNK